MTGTLSTQETSQTPWEPDTSLLDAAREIAAQGKMKAFGLSLAGSDAK
jgi:hypothetical protein